MKAVPTFIIGGAFLLHRRRRSPSRCSQLDQSKRLRVPLTTLRDRITVALYSQGHTISADVECLADTLLYAELRGNNQGIVKLINNDLAPSPGFKGAVRCSVVHETAVSAKLDGEQRPGMCVLQEALNAADGIAKANGAGVVGVNNY
jgi:LDH2 family malate/lactate/ureidoglycolate dehydrogenase